MAILNCIYTSEVLGIKTGMNVILPEPSKEDARTASELCVFTLLHGLDGNYMSWCTNTRIQDIAEKYRVAVVMPEAKNSFYCRTREGDYFTHIAQEVPEVATRYFGFSREARLNHIAGISMGGFGALKIGLSHPERYATIGSFSSLTDIEGQITRSNDLPDHERSELERVFGKTPHLGGTENDLMQLAHIALCKRSCPRIYQFCATEDFLYADNRRYLSALKAMGHQVTYSESPGEHLWTVWAEQIWDYIPYAMRISGELL